MRIQCLPKTILILISALCGISVLMLYSAAGGAMHPWALKQLIRIGIGYTAFFTVMLCPIYRLYEWTYIVYFFALTLLIATKLIGLIGMGAQRWIDLHVFNIQPSEIMRVALILVLARYFSDHAHVVRSFKTLITPFFLTMVPVVLIAEQPDLGTALLMLATSAIMAAIAGVSWRKFALGALMFCAAIPLAWMHMHDYQKNRIMIFINPALDPKKSGYHMTQSKIALGSGGLGGKGFLQGSQSHLHFLPEKQTDFIFTMFCEEFGLIGAMLLMSLYLILIGYGYHIALVQKKVFPVLIASGITSALFFYVFINMAMVMGLMPVVGIPLPFVSYGGTALISLLISQGILCSIYAEYRMKNRSIRFLR